MKQNTKAIIYARSASGKAKLGEPTVQDQVEAVRKYCKANHIDVMMEMNFAKEQSKQLSGKIKAGLKRKKMEQGKSKIVRFTAAGRGGKKSHYQKEIVQPFVIQRLASK